MLRFPWARAASREVRTATLGARDEEPPLSPRWTLQAQEGLLELARRAWPELGVPGEDFVESVAARCPDDVDPSALDIAGLYLAHLCLRGDPAALAAFEREEIAATRRFLAGRERDASIADELLQRVRTRVLLPRADGRPPRLADFSGRGGLRAWLRIIALREHLDAHRAPHRAPGRDIDSDDDVGAVVVAPELALLRARYLDSLNTALRDALRAQPPRDRTLLRMHYVDGLSLSSMGALYRVNKGTISRWLANAREAVLSEVLATLQHEIGCSPAEAQSLARVLRSELHLTLPGLFAD